MPTKDPELRRLRQRGYSKRWYAKNRARQIYASWKTKDRVRRLWNEYKSGLSCSHCGVQHPAVIDFHHVIKEGKKSVNDLVKRNYNLKAAIREAEEKCIPLCANCHRILHWNEHQHGAKRRRKKRLKKHDGNRWGHTRSPKRRTRVHERLHSNDRVQVPDTGGDPSSMLGGDSPPKR